MKTEVRNGWVIVSELVTDGYQTWLHTERFMYYSVREARSLYRQSVANNGWEVAYEA